MRFTLRFIALIPVLVGMAMILVPSIREKRLELRVRSTLLTVQEALQRLHVADEEYPRKRLSGHDLVKLLVDRKFLNPTLPNPWTGKSYLSDASQDCLLYHSDQEGEIYNLSVVSPKSKRVLFQLDSTEHQSLEEEK